MTDLIMCLHKRLMKILLLTFIYAYSTETVNVLVNDLLPTDYQPLASPIVDDGGPVQVRLGLVINQILFVDESEQSLKLDVHCELSWTDNRIRLPANVSHVSLNGRWRSAFWTPEAYFLNSLSTMQSASTMTKFDRPGLVDVLSHPIFIEINHHNRVTINSRQLIKFSCLMDLFNFPQDSQECNVDIASITQEIESMNLSWSFLEMRKLSNDFPKFEIPRYSAQSCVSIRGPNYSCLRANVKLFRRITYYAIRIYGPSLLLVVICFVSFWIPLSCYPARIALVVTPLLSLITQQTQIYAEITVSYVVALHIWMIVCIGFVFLSMLEMVCAVEYCRRLEDKQKMLEMNMRHGRDTVFVRQNRCAHWIKWLLNRVYGHQDWPNQSRERNKVDYISRLLFPFLLTLFILVYTGVFLFPWLITKYS